MKKTFIKKQGILLINYLNNVILSKTHYIIYVRDNLGRNTPWLIALNSNHYTHCIVTLKKQETFF